MNILLICNKSPWPPKEGGPIAMNAMVEGLLNSGHQVKILAINSYKYNVNLDSIPENYRKRTQIELINLDLRIKLIPALLNLFTSKSYHVERFISHEFSSAITRILKNEKFDVIQLESLFVTPYISLIRKYSKGLIILRAHNIEHLIWERLYKGEINPLKKLYLRHLSRTLKKYEIDAIKDVDGVVAITNKDAQFFSSVISKEKVLAIPFGIQPEVINNFKREIKKPVSVNTIFHLGSMNWMPNVEGIIWFLKEVWPEVSKLSPSLVLHLAGREMPENIRSYSSERVIIDGEIENAIDYMHEYKVMIVPLFSGSGIRIKIIEGMLAQCAIITTSIGAEGISYISGKHLLIADTKMEFIDNINRLIQNKDKIYELGSEASEFVSQHHNNTLLIEQLESFYHKLLH
jgi:glycosyltransferase involved in cell wall biosynthesis